MSFSKTTTIITFSLLASIGLSAVSVALADSLHFYDGREARKVKITSVAGDLIDYKHGYGQTGSTQRLQLLNRQDTIQTIFAGKIYHGELMYLDDYKAEIATELGPRKVWRMWIKNITLGNPNGVMPSNQNPGIHNVANTMGSSMGNSMGNAMDTPYGSVNSPEHPAVEYPSH